MIRRDSDDWKRYILTNWPYIIGNLHTRIMVEKIEGDTIIVGVYDSCWLQELYMLSSMILHRINENLDQPYLKKIRFKQVGYQKKKPTTPTPAAHKEKKTITLSAAEERMLGTINDPELRSALKAFLIRCYQEK